jgi:hypothetical protein
MVRRPDIRRRDLPGVSDHDPALSRHILPTAATMLGICTTLIGLVKIVEERIGPSHVDEYGALIAGLFLVSALASYGAMRTAHWSRLSRRCEQAADLCFMIGLVSLTILVLLFAYEVV